MGRGVFSEGWLGINFRVRIRLGVGYLVKGNMVSSIYGEGVIREGVIREGGFVRNVYGEG